MSVFFRLETYLFIIFAVLRQSVRVTNGGAHLRGLAPGQYSSEETSQRWQAVGDAVSDSTGWRIEPMTSRADSDAFNQ